MKKIIKFSDIKIILISIALVAFQSIIFFLTKPFIHAPYVLNSKLDMAIPFISHFIWIYVFWYFMLFAVPFYIAKNNKNSFYKYIATYIITTIIAGLIFVVFPNCVIRPDVQNTNIACRLVNIIYTLDTPSINCLPSIHCLFSYLFILSVFDIKKDTSIHMKVIITTLSLLVVLSTLFIKQHVVYDAIASLILAIVVWIIVDKIKIYSIFNKLFNDHIQ